MPLFCFKWLTGYRSTWSNFVVLCNLFLLAFVLNKLYVKNKIRVNRSSDYFSCLTLPTAYW